MAKTTSNRLWAVKFYDEYYPRRNYSVHGDLNTSSPILIVASSSEVAGRKAQRWLKTRKDRHGVSFKGYTVSSVGYEGTIDVF